MTSIHIAGECSNYNICGKIKPEIHRGDWTNTAVKRIAAVASTIICGVGTVLSAAAATTSTSALLPFTAIALGAATYYSIKFLATAHDYDNIDEREKLIDQIARQSLSKIARGHKTKSVVGYGLLQQIGRADLYQSYANLAESVKREDQKHERDVSRVENDYNQMMAPTRAARDAAVNRANIHQMARRNARNERCRAGFEESGWSRAIHTLGTGLDIHNEFRAFRAVSTAEGIYGQDRQAALTRVNQEHADTIGRLNREFDTIRNRA